jgi:uncharacterized protein (TIGR02466 family)
MSDFQPARAEVLPVFSTPFLRGQLDLDTDLIAQDCRDLVSEVKKRCPNDNARNYTTYFDDDIRKKMWELDWFKQFSNTIKDTYISFIAGTFEQDVAYLQRNHIHLFAWINVYNKQHQHEIHNHVNSYMSGTYYIETGDNTTPIRFYSPAQMANFSLQTRDREVEREGLTRVRFLGTAGIENEMSVYPIPNEFLMWPSYILHSVPPIYDEEVTNDYERISLSFNMKHIVPIDENETGDNLSYEFFNNEQ